MNNKIVTGVIVALVVIGGLFYFTQKQYAPTKEQQTVQPQTEIAENTITIQNFSFSPGILTVPQGTKVTWINRDTAVHTVNSDAFNSSDLRQGDTFEFTFDTKGSFEYVCGLHPSMTGSIVVE